MARVSLDGVSKVFAGGVAAVNGLNLEVNDREFLVLVGPSGCGKSTTLRLVAGLEQATAGVVRIGQREVNQVPARQRNVAMVFQNQPLYPQYTVSRNLEFGLRQHTHGDWLTSIWKGLARSQTAAGPAAKRSGGARNRATLVREAARGLGVEHLLDRFPRQLSGGERQRVALGRAIVRNPAVFLLDEPLSNLDANLRIELRRLIRQMHDQSQAATIHVTHDQAEALALADRVAVMEQGKIRQIGSPLEVYDRPQNRFVASFIGNPPMNLVEGELVEKNGKWQVRGDDLAIELIIERREQNEDLRERKDVDLVCGVRAERLIIVPAREASLQEYSQQVSLVEHLGDESWIHITSQNRTSQTTKASPPSLEKFPASKLIGKTNTRTPLRPGEAVTVSCAAAHAHWFDRRSGERLT